MCGCHSLQLKASLSDTDRSLRNLLLKKQKKSQRDTFRLAFLSEVVLEKMDRRWGKHANRQAHVRDGQT